MNRLTATLLALCAGAATVVVGGSAAAAHDAAGSAAQSPPTAQQQLAAARAATATYHDVTVAIADGFVGSEECAELPGIGGMGYHFMNMANVADGVFDPAKPELLLYAPTADGLRLAGVEYLKIDADQDLTTDGDRPSLFGVPFDGPMPGHEPGMPIHYDLHVWVWMNNPGGLFSAWNPDLHCAGQ